jgi:CDP-glucose 4,6-dehydratase
VEDLVSLSQRQSLGQVSDRSYRGRRVLVTGHNGFVGSWLSFWLAQAGAEVVGFALPAQPGGAAEALDLDSAVTSIEGDVRDRTQVEELIGGHEPEIVFHLAAQALVIPSFDEPLATLATNVMGTAHVLDAVRRQPSVRACVVITSDKCYALSAGAHEEGDPLGGEDPYSASKAAAEMVVHAYRSSFFAGSRVGVATARAGNIMGGGDWADYRIVPDCARAVIAGEPVRIRHPEAVRPWQHVLDAVAGYLRLGDGLLIDPTANAQAWNFGPPSEAAATVSEVVAMLFARWRALGETGVRDPEHEADSPVPERSFLTLVSDKARSRLGWLPLLDLQATIDWTVDWYHSVAAIESGNAVTVTTSQIARYLELDARAVGCSGSPPTNSATASRAAGRRPDDERHRRDVS